MSEIVRPELAIDLPTQQRIETAGGGWEFQRDHSSQWCWTANTFSSDELDAIIRIGEEVGLVRGRTGGGDNTEIRNSLVSWLFPHEITNWVFDRMANMVVAMNDEYFGFDLQGFFQGFQFTKYTAPGQHYTWHCDKGPMNGVRKLSVSLLLSDPDDYEGGDLQLKYGEQEQTVERVRGMATLFPSWSLHRVTPVTKGTRYSLVAWVSGPPFK